MKGYLILIFACLILLTGCKEQIPEDNSSDDISTIIQETDSQNDGIQHSTIDTSPSDMDIIEIKEKMFIAQTNDIYINSEDYLGKTIKYEGIFTSIYYDVKDTNYNFVIRYGPGCCGYDDNAGFEVVWSGEYPDENDWVRAIGVLEEYEEDGEMYLRLNLSSLTVLDTRGEEYVYQ